MDWTTFERHGGVNLPDRLRRRAKRVLSARYEEFEDLYLRHRRAVETLVHESKLFTPVTLGHFAAGQAALEMAWHDGVISREEHAWLLQAFTAMMSHSVDYFSDCDAGFKVDVNPPLAMLTEPELAAIYMTAACTCRADIKRRADDVRLFFELAFFDNELLASPFRLDATGTILWAKHRRELGERRAAELEVFFVAMHILVEQFDLGLPEIADYLEHELKRHAENGEQASLAESETEDEWQGW